MSTALVVISDGRGYLERSIPSLIEHAKPEWFDYALVVEDGPITGHSMVAVELLGNWLGRVVTTSHHTERLGGAQAIQTAWTWVARTQADYVFHLEEDWTFPEAIPLPDMIDVLDADPALAQVCLRRQSWWGEGPNGYIGDDPAAFSQHYRNGVPYLVHSKGFWLNPCVYPARVAAMGWPDGGHEHHFTSKVRAAGLRSAVYGTHSDAPRCHHIGDERSAAWTW